MSKWFLYRETLLRRPWGRTLLRGMSGLYGVGVHLRHAAYEYGILKGKSAPLPVISVGNIAAGGTGKTPLVKWIAEQLTPTVPVAILTRGYRSQMKKGDGVVRLELQSKECGDEAYWLAYSLPQVEVVVGKDRLSSAHRAYERGAKVVILDDGLQYRKLKREIEIITLDGERPLAEGCFLPLGLLRDTPLRLKKADLIVIKAPFEASTLSLVRRFSSAPIIGVSLDISPSLKGKRVAAFCAIGNPNSFIHSIRESGGEVVGTFFKPDHDAFQVDELRIFLKKHETAEVLVCTEKDWVKLPLHNHLPLLPIRAKLKISMGEPEWGHWIQKIKQMVR